jgi:serine/threonine protein kinase/formylglycine-generating enzyme required for sulfatase activity
MMSATKDNDASRDERLFDVIAAYVEARDQGQVTDRLQWLARYPEFAEELEAFFATRDRLEVLAAPQTGALAQPVGAPAEASLPPAHPELGQLGDFHLLREIGRGGMGVVYEADQISLGRRVALKVLPFAAALDPKQMRRFQNEARAAGHLHHTHIVPVHAVGCERGVHFYAMQFIEGQTVAGVIRELRENVECRMTNDQRMANAQGPSTSGPEPGAQGETIVRHSTFGILSSLGIGHSSFFRTVAQLGVQAAEALEHAHDEGVIHRDIKPANLLVDAKGQLWITDFGLARCRDNAGLTTSGDMVGTLRYMSPEQALAKRVLIDHRTDIYSLGVTLYELLTLEPAFSGSDREELLRQIAFEEPRAPRQRNKAIPRELETIVLKATEKSREARYATAQELADDLRRFLEDKPIQAKRPTLLQRAAKWARRHKTVVQAGGVVLGLAVLALVVSTLLIGRAQQRTQQEEWMREVVIPTLRHLVTAKDYRTAFELAEKAERAIANDPTLAELRPEFTSSWTVSTDPPGADVYAKPYERSQEEWKFLGRSPLEKVRLPRGFFRWHVTKEGFTTVEGFREPVEGHIHFTLEAEGSLPAGMVRVSGNAFREKSEDPDDPNGLDLEDYLIDRCEVTNRQFKKFVDQGGYRERKYWKQFPTKQTAPPLLYASILGLLDSPLAQGAWVAAGALFPGRTEQMVLSWEVTINAFRDQAGQPGPYTWRSGTYPAGEDEYPVRGVSWYEAAAYAQFACKSLPTVAHWLRASGQPHAGDITPLSNFASTGPARVGKYSGLGPFGTLDMAGNVKEWCWNKSDGDRRFILGGAWEEPAYLFTATWDTASAFDRSPANGFRCMRYLSAKITPAAVKDIHGGDRDYQKERPVSDELFQFFKSLFAYDKAPLNARTESVEQSADTIHETITFDAAYGKERVSAHLYLPRQRTPPYQTVVFFPWVNVFDEKSFPRENPPDAIAFLVRNGRAVLWPVYKGSFERWEQAGWRTSDSAARQWAITGYQDLARSVDYLQERSDIDREKLAFYSVSSVGHGCVILALENRFKVAVVAFFGLLPWRVPLTEFDAVHYVPRVRVPILMINSRNDPHFSLEKSQVPMFRLLGTPDIDKLHRVYDAPGHGVPVPKFEKDMFSWLDRYLGKVR